MFPLKSVSIPLGMKESILPAVGHPNSRGEWHHTEQEEGTNHPNAFNKYIKFTPQIQPREVVAGIPTANAEKNECTSQSELRLPFPKRCNKDVFLCHRIGEQDPKPRA